MKKAFSIAPRTALVLRVISFATVCGVATILLGKDSNWDLFNYHLYVAHAFWGNYDLQSDFMAASLQRYLNPVGYLPFYWMIQAGWHSVVIGLLLGAFHSLALVFLWQICAKHLFKDDSQPVLLTCLSVVLAAMSPVFLGTLGATFLDPAMMVFIFGGLLLLCVPPDRPSMTALLPMLAGCLLGIASGLKLTNLIFVASAGVAILVASRFKVRGWRTSAYFGTGAAIGAILSGGWWSFRLYREFGNPFFPLFNDYFRSPDFPDVKLQLIRFKPETFWDALTFPFDMASSRMWVYAENGSADIRFALLVVFGMMLLAFRLWRFRNAGAKDVSTRNEPIALVTAFFLVSFALWVWTSGNGRYGVTLLLLVAPILVLAVRTAIPNRNRFAGTMLFIFVAQGIVLSLGEPPRWDSGAWSKNWINVDMPAKLKENPYGYLSAGINSNSFLALHVHPESRLVNLIGSFPLSLDGPGGHRVSEFMSAHAGKLRMLAKLEIPPSLAPKGSNDLNDYLKELDGRYAIWDLRIDTTDCEQFQFSVGPPMLPATLISCALIPGNPRRASMMPEWERVSRVFDRIENACPVLFNPRGTYTTKRGQAWYRLYLNTEVRLRALNGQVLYSRDPFGPFGVNMGTLEDWESGVSKWICSGPQPHWKLPDINVLEPTPIYHPR